MVRLSFNHIEGKNGVIRTALYGKERHIALVRLYAQSTVISFDTQGWI